jgi:hypothetical protein
MIPALAAAADPDDADDVGIVVTVTAPPATPAPTNGGGGGGGSGGGGGGGGGGDDGVDLPTEGLPPDGILNVGGLTSTPALSFDPLGGEVTVRVTVENVSNSEVGLRARATLTGPFGTELDRRVFWIPPLEPGELRTIDVTLDGPGQWTFVTAHLALTPPDEVDGIPLDPIRRDQFVVVFPWLVACLLIAGAAAALVVHLLRGREVAAVPAEAT